MTSLCKALESSDYQEIHHIVRNIEYTITALTKQGGRLSIQHPHDLWQYASTIHALTTHFDNKLNRALILDIGSGNSPLAPTLSYMYQTQVEEEDPDLESTMHRRHLNEILARLHKPEILRGRKEISQLKELGDYNAVCCLSVLQNLSLKQEEKAWEVLSKLVRKNGILFLTLPIRQKMIGGLRTYTPKMIEERIQALSSLGFAAMGRPDYEYHGDYVADHSYFRIGMLKIDVSNHVEAVYRKAAYA